MFSYEKTCANMLLKFKKFNADDLVEKMCIENHLVRVLCNIESKGI